MRVPSRHPRYFTVIAYDVADDRRRVRTMKLLARYAERVQRSVFEGYLTDAELEKLLAALSRTLVDHDDDVRVYRLCATCREQTRFLGRAHPLRILETIVI